MGKLKIPDKIIEKWASELSIIYSIPNEFWKDIDKHIEQEKKDTETECSNKLLEAFNIESIPSNVDTFEKLLIYIKSLNLFKKT